MEKRVTFSANEPEVYEVKRYINPSDNVDSNTEPPSWPYAMTPDAPVAPLRAITPPVEIRRRSGLRRMFETLVHRLFRDRRMSYEV